MPNRYLTTLVTEVNLNDFAMLRQNSLSEHGHLERAGRDERHGDRDRERLLAGVPLDPVAESVLREERRQGRASVSRAL